MQWERPWFSGRDVCDRLVVRSGGSYMLHGDDWEMGGCLGSSVKLSMA
jgi:hypothetical protein